MRRLTPPELTNDKSTTHVPHFGSPQSASMSLPRYCASSSCIASRHEAKRRPDAVLTKDKTTLWLFDCPRCGHTTVVHEAYLSEHIARIGRGVRTILLVVACFLVVGMVLSALGLHGSGGDYGDEDIYYRR